MDFMASIQPTIQKANFDICTKKSQNAMLKIFHGKTYFT